MESIIPWTENHLVLHDPLLFTDMPFSNDAAHSSPSHIKRLHAKRVMWGYNSVSNLWKCFVQTLLTLYYLSQAGSSGLYRHRGSQTKLAALLIGKPTLAELCVEVLLCPEIYALHASVAEMS